MHRREFLKSSSVAALAASGSTAIAAAPASPALAMPALTTKRRELRLVTRFEDRPGGSGDMVRRLAARIVAASEGAMRIVVETSSEGSLDMIKNGAADLYMQVENDNSGAHPAFHYLAGLPCGVGLDAASFEAWLTVGGGQELWDELSGLFDIKSLAVGNTGPSLGVFSNRPIRQSADLRGMRIAIEGLAREVLLACDADMAPLPRLAPADALDERRIDAVEVLHGDFPFHDRRASTRLNRETHIMHPGLNRQGLTISMGMRRSFWDQLANSERIMLTALAAEARAMEQAELLAHRQQAEQMAAASGPWPLPMSSPAELARDLESIAATVVAEMSGRDRMTRRINASYMAFRALHTNSAVA